MGRCQAKWNLDIEMPGMNAFQMLEELEEINFAIIFTTAHSQYAIQAFEFSAKLLNLIAGLNDRACIYTISHISHPVDGKTIFRLSPAAK